MSDNEVNSYIKIKFGATVSILHVLVLILSIGILLSVTGCSDKESKTNHKNKRHKETVETTSNSVNYKIIKSEGYELNSYMDDISIYPEDDDSELYNWASKFYANGYTISSYLYNEADDDNDSIQIFQALGYSHIDGKLMAIHVRVDYEPDADIVWECEEYYFFEEKYNVETYSDGVIVTSDTTDSDSYAKLTYFDNGYIIYEKFYVPDVLLDSDGNIIDITGYKDIYDGLEDRDLKNHLGPYIEEGYDINLLNTDFFSDSYFSSGISGFLAYKEVSDGVIGDVEFVIKYNSIDEAQSDISDMFNDKFEVQTDSNGNVIYNVTYNSSRVILEPSGIATCSMDDFEYSYKNN